MLINKKISTFFNEIPKHTHTRGSMNITGSIVSFTHSNASKPTGAFYSNGNFSWYTSFTAGSTSGFYSFYFDASRTWTGLFYV